MEKIDFKATDGVMLNGLLYNSKQETKDIIIAIHGMSSNCFKKRDDVIAQKANENNIDYFCFNNRGAELVKYIKKEVNGKEKKELAGTSYEDVLEGYNDIVGAIQKMQEIGYTNIHLQGHSLGCTKIVYTYNRLLEENNLKVLNTIKSIILLSLVDIPTTLEFFLNNKKEEYIKLAKNKIEEGKEKELMPTDCFIHPISAKSFFRYISDNKEIDFINPIKDEKLKVLNNINIPIFMRWGNVQEMILQEASQYVETIRKIIKNEKANIDFIDGADHGYTDKEGILAEQIIQFIQN